MLIICLLMNLSSSGQSRISVLLGDLSRSKTDSQKVEAYKSILSYYSSRNVDSFNYFTDRSIDFAKKSNYPLGEGIIFAQLGLIDENQGRVDLAKQRINSALEIFKEQRYLKGIAEMDHNLGVIEGRKGNFDVAIKYFVSALKLYDTIVDNHGLMLAYMNLGNLYTEHDDTTNAAKYLLLAENISKKIPVEDATISLYNAIGVMYASKGDTQKAHQYFLNNLSLSNKPGFSNSHVESIIYLGEFYLNSGSVDKALDYLEQGLKIVQTSNMPEMESNILMEIAQVTMDKDPAKAMVYLDSARAIAEKTHNNYFLINVYKTKVDIYKRQNDFKEALHYTELKQKLADSIFNINKVKEIASISSAYEFEKSKQRINQLEVLNKKNATERNATIIAGLAIFSILLVLFFYYRKSVNLNRRLKTREKELEETNGMKDKLFSIIGHDLRAPLARIPAILDIYDDPETTDEEKTFMFEHLKEHTKASLETLDKLLYWGHSLMKGIRLNQVKMKTRPFINENIELIKIKAAEKEIFIVDKTPDRLSIFADTAHFDFIVRNLLANALKYTYPKGRIIIDADNALRPGYIVFSVKDNGVGIKSTAIANIFNPLVSTPGTADEKGTGIGLMLCKEFVTKNGGEIWVESIDGNGTTFFFTFKNDTPDQLLP